MNVRLMEPHRFAVQQSIPTYKATVLSLCAGLGIADSYRSEVQCTYISYSSEATSDNFGPHCQQVNKSLGDSFEHTPKNSPPHKNIKIETTRLVFVFG